MSCQSGVDLIVGSVWFSVSVGRCIWFDEKMSQRNVTTTKLNKTNFKNCLTERISIFVYKMNLNSDWQPNGWLTIYRWLKVVNMIQFDISKYSGEKYFCCHLINKPESANRDKISWSKEKRNLYAFDDSTVSFIYIYVLIRRII